MAIAGHWIDMIKFSPRLGFNWMPYWVLHISVSNVLKGTKKNARASDYHGRHWWMESYMKEAQQNRLIHLFGAIIVWRHSLDIFVEEKAWVVAHMTHTRQISQQLKPHFDL